jgi:hypothetical protein
MESESVRDTPHGGIFVNFVILVICHKYFNVIFFVEFRIYNTLNHMYKV